MLTSSAAESARAPFTPMPVKVWANVTGKEVDAGGWKVTGGKGTSSMHHDDAN